MFYAATEYTGDNWCEVDSAFSLGPRVPGSILNSGKSFVFCNTFIGFGFCPARP